MAKKVVAVTAIKHGTTDKAFTFEPGEELDPKVFTEKQLRELYAAGAVRIEDEAAKSADKSEDTETNPGEASQSVNDKAPQQEDPESASVAVTAKTAKPVSTSTSTPTKGTQSAQK